MTEIISEGKYTPATIGKWLFEIPLYQRLFEWTENEIRQLLSDLYDSYSKAKVAKDFNRPYYIGMLTVYQGEKKQRLDLVDGQQRFTVMTLISVVQGWENFYWSHEDNNLRLTFFAREPDEEYVKFLCKKGAAPKDGYINAKMCHGIKCIEKFFSDLNCEDRLAFDKYIKENMTFFITPLPQRYTLADLNKYFEAMNSAGRALENYEILKVKLLKSIDSDKELYSRLWNIVADMDVPLVRKIKEGKKTEAAATFRNRYFEAMSCAKKSPNIFLDRNIKTRLLNDIYSIENEQKLDSKACKNIRDIAARTQQPKPRELNFSEIGLFSFPLFLLLVLYQVLKDKDEIQVAEFFKVGNLLDTFEKYKDKFKVDVFLQKLVYYRLILDYYFIRQNADGFPYVLDDYVYDEDAAKDEGLKSAKKKLIQFQSMLFVSSTPVTYYRWLSPALEYIESSERPISPVDFLNKLKQIDNDIDEHKGVPSEEALSYQNIDRYWFWRLDYYLWENREVYFNALEDRTVAENYAFRRNRSIEHIAPQNPIGGSAMKWNSENERFLHCFGNLAMISSGQNSLLLNKPYEEKQGHVKAFVSGSMAGSVESLKMLKIYQIEKWNVDEIQKHQKEMIGVLIKSYNSHFTT